MVVLLGCEEDQNAREVRAPMLTGEDLVSGGAAIAPQACPTVALASDHVEVGRWVVSPSDEATMTKRRQKHIFHVQLARLRMETSIVTVEVNEFDDDLAAEAALAQADRLPTTAWRPQPNNPADYRPFVQALIAKEELKLPAVDEFDIEEQIEDEAEIRYVLLMANCGTGQGDVVLQPWLATDPPDLMASDLMRDWIAGLQHLGLTHISQRLDDLAGGAEPQISDAILFGARLPPKRKPKA